MFRFKSKLMGNDMTGLNYITNEKGEKTFLLLPLSKKKRYSIEEIEDLQDAIAYELLKDEESVDFFEGIDSIISKKEK